MVMKRLLILTGLLICHMAIMAGNPVMESTSTASSGYLVGFDGWSNSELKKVDVSISELIQLIKDYKNNNPKLKNNSSTYSSGYLVGIDNFSNPEIRKVNVSIAELVKMMNEYENNPTLKNSFPTYSSGYLVGIGTTNSNLEIRKLNISIDKLETMMEEFEELKRLIESLETDNGIAEMVAMKEEINDLKLQLSDIASENTAIKRQLAQFEAANAALYEFVGFTPPDTDTASNAPAADTLPLIYAENKTIVVENANGESVSVYNLEGQTVISTNAVYGTIYIPLIQVGVYLVKVNTYTVKIVVP
jgi:predicted RNase H-like nuclease (RuvC/YqgF family)